MDDRVPVRAPAGQVMSDEVMDRLLRTLDEVCREAWSEAVEAERAQEELSQAGFLPGERARPGLRIDPWQAFANERTLLAEDVANEQDRIARRLIAWWVDAATCAAVAAVRGTPLTAARAVAGDPSLCLEPEELIFLPPIAEEDWQLARLAVEMDGALPEGQLCGSQEFAAGVGLAVRRSSVDGQVMLVEDGVPEARRRRLWGPTWKVYRMPPLPETGGFVRAMTEIGVPATVTAAIRQASDAVDAALRARMRAIELDEQDDVAGDTDRAALDAEAVESWGHYDRLPELLIDYARTLSEHLPELRAARLTPADRPVAEG